MYYIGCRTTNQVCCDLSSRLKRECVLEVKRAELSPIKVTTAVFSFLHAEWSGTLQDEDVCCALSQRDILVCVLPDPPVQLEQCPGSARLRMIVLDVNF